MTRRFEIKSVQGFQQRKLATKDRIDASELVNRRGLPEWFFYSYELILRAAVYRF
jgi:hypothetical protein